MRNKLNLDRALRQLDDLIGEDNLDGLDGEVNEMLGESADQAIEILRGPDGRIAGARNGNRHLHVVRDERGKAVSIETVN